MSQIVKTFLGVFLILFMTVTSIGILSAYMEVLHAQDLQSRLVDEIENSDYALEVLRAGYGEAENAGCGLCVTLFYEGGGTVSASSAAQIPESTEGVEMARVDLTFPFRVIPLGIQSEHTFTGYAR